MIKEEKILRMQREVEELLSAHEKQLGIIPKPGQTFDERMALCEAVLKDYMEGKIYFPIDHEMHPMYGFHKKFSLIFYSLMSFLLLGLVIFDVGDLGEVKFLEGFLTVTSFVIGCIWLNVGIGWIKVWIKKLKQSKSITSEPVDQWESQRSAMFDTWKAKEDEKQRNCTHQWSFASPVICLKCALSKEKFEQSKQ